MMQSDMSSDPDMRKNSRYIHGGVDGDARTGAVSVPIYQTSTYRQPELGRHSGYEYSRTGNPTREALEKLIAELEEGEAGFAFASGMAAITAVLFLFRAGDKFLVSHNVYGGTFRVLDKVFKNYGVDYELVDTSDLAAVERKIDGSVRAILIESPANPLLTVTDIAAVSTLAHSRGLLVIVDNTFMTPYLQQPLKLGTDIVLHSATKYLGGHSDLVAGLAVVSTPQLAERLHFIQNATGGILEPFDSWLLIRGIKTLPVRMERHLENAAFIADWLRGHEAVEKVYYPGFDDFPGHDTQARQAAGAGAIISFTLRPGHDIEVFYDSLRLITLGESLGGVESLACHPATMTHASIPYELRQQAGIVDGLVRLSVGLEDKRDIAGDLDRALRLAGRERA